MSTEYTFDGLDEWEKNLAQIIDRQYPEEFKQMVIDIAEQALGKAKELTPVQTGRLRDAWNLGTIEKRGDTYYIEIYNNVEYAEPVEYGRPRCSNVRRQQQSRSRRVWHAYYPEYRL